MDIINRQKTAGLDSYLRSSRKVTVTAHTHPDGDALGSVTAMRSYLEGRGLDVRAVLPDEYPDTIAFIDKDRKTAFGTFAEDTDLIICLDFNNFSRTGEMERSLVSSKAKKVLIDHHLNPDTEKFDLVFSSPDVSSTCELLYYILMQMPDIGGKAENLPLLCAEALMAGMTTDSNNFANSVFPSTLQMASELLAAGVDRDSIISNLYNEYRENRVRAMSYLLSERLHVCENGLAYIILDKATSQRFGLQDGETEGLVNIPLSIGKVRISALLKEDEGHYRVSLRSKKSISVNGLAEQWFHGGGHAQASGGKLYFPEDIKDTSETGEYIENAVAQFLQNTDK